MSGDWRLWMEAFPYADPAALEWAFREFFLGHLVDQYGNVSGTFFPKIAQIEQLVRRYHQQQAEQRRDQEQEKYFADIRAAKAQLEAEGQPTGLAQLHALFKEFLLRMKPMP